MAQIIKVFIASPSDVRQERQLAEKAIHELNKKLGNLYDYALVPEAWESFASISAQNEQDRPQDGITPWVRESHIFVGILYKRYGSPAHPPSRLSGTEEEFDVAIKHRDRIRILTYFRDVPRGARLNSDFKKVSSMRERLRKKGIVPKEYRTPNDFFGTLMLDLLEVVVSNMPDWQYRHDIVRFFQLGRSPDQSDYRVMICYPPIHGHDPGRSQGKQGNYDWHRRLVPNVVFEDVKAIQRLDGSLRKIGVRAVRAISTASPDVHAFDYNKIWLCLPRNRLAQNRLKNSYLGRARFKLLENPQGHYDIQWTQSTREGRPRVVTVRSPLGHYLKERGKDAARSGWKDEYGNVVARDFAIIARFKYCGPYEDRAVRNYPFWEYFIFGIRGLGTWGAGWFVYHKADKLAQIVEAQGDGDVQTLLQVTYHRHRIVEVIDVSDKPQQYFDDQNRPETIRSVMEEYSTQ